MAKEFLAEDGILFVSINDTEQPYLRIILDEIFHPCEKKNRLACFVWQTDGNFDNQAKVKDCHEYILAYTKNFMQFPAPPVIDPNISTDSKLFKHEIRNTIVKNGFKNPVSELLLPKDFPTSFESGIIKKRNNAYPHYVEDLTIKNYRLCSPVIAQSGWSSKKIVQKYIDNNFEPVTDTKDQETSFVITKTGAIECIKKRNSSQSHVISVLKNFGSTQSTSQELAKIGLNFDYPKPPKLLEFLISMIEDKNSIVLDFFCGSGSTGDAVLNINKIDNGNRKFILIEQDENIIKNIALPRLRHNIDSNSKLTGICFNYIGKPLFDESGKVFDGVIFSQLAKHVYFTETGRSLEKGHCDSPLIGEYNETAIYLLFNGILKDKRPNSGNVLTGKILLILPEYAGTKVIYGTACRVSKAKLREKNIIFKQIPYDINVG